MDAETTTDQHFIIDEQEYPVPDPDDVSMGEAMAIETYGVQLAELGPDATLTASVIAALMHVAITRKHPGISSKEARAIVERQNLVAALQAFADALPEDDAGPLDGTDASTSSTSISGEGSGNGSDGSQADGQSPIGQLRSVTLPASDLATSQT